ncbi:lipoprotein [Streptomyces sp. RSD-27]|nr:lipoprotein [Streptomyces sp. RSD-27]
MRLPHPDARAFRHRYGASPLHLLLVLASFALALYAGVRLLRGDAVGVALWFVGAALLHDLVLLPLYAVTDRAVQALFGPGAGGPGARVSVNHVRVPAFIAGVLLLVWWPLVLRRVDHFTVTTALPADVFLPRWLLITAVLFAASAAVLLVRVWWGTREGRRDARARARARRAAERRRT